MGRGKHQIVKTNPYIINLEKKLGELKTAIKNAPLAYVVRVVKTGELKQVGFDKRKLSNDWCLTDDYEIIPIRLLEEVKG